MVRRSTAALAAGSCCLVFAVTSSVYAQPAHDSQTASAVADITARLGSGDPQRVAWGAYFAAQNNLTTMVPALSSALVTTPGADPWVLDALIQLHGRLPAAQLTATYDRWPVQSLILLADSDDERDAVLIELFKRVSGYAWFAIANLLMESKSPELPRALLRDLKLSLTIDLVPYEGMLPGRSGGSVGNCRAGRSLSRVGYPPLGHYTFAAAQHGATVLAHGPHPVYYYRWIGFDRTADDGQGPTHKDRIEYLAALAGYNDEKMPLRAETFAVIVWKGDEAFQREVARLRQDITFRYHSLLQRLVAYGRMTASDAELLEPAIDIRVADYRK